MSDIADPVRATPHPMRLSAIGTTIDSGVIVCFRVAGAVILLAFRSAHSGQGDDRCASA